MGPDPTLWGKAALLPLMHHKPFLLPFQYCHHLIFFDSLVLGVYRVNTLGIFSSLVPVWVFFFYWNGLGLVSLPLGMCHFMCLQSLLDTLYFLFSARMFGLGVFSLVCLAAIWVIQSHKKHPSYRSLLLWGATVGLLFGTREHGIVVLLSILPTILIVSHRRLRTMVLFCIGLQIGGSIASEPPTQPFFFSTWRSQWNHNQSKCCSSGFYDACTGRRGSDLVA